MKDVSERIINILDSVLQLGSRADGLTDESPLLGAIPEFDSMAVVSVLTAIEEEYDFFVEDDEIDASIFETVGSLADFVSARLDA
jgi:acyl carrier protein